jgi:hypothetical protein
MQEMMLACSEIIFSLAFCSAFLHLIKECHYCETSTRTPIVLCSGLSPHSIASSPHQTSRSLPGLLSFFLHSVKVVLAHTYKAIYDGQEGLNRSP